MTGAATGAAGDACAASVGGFVTVGATGTRAVGGRGVGERTDATPGLATAVRAEVGACGGSPTRAVAGRGVGAAIGAVGLRGAAWGAAMGLDVAAAVSPRGADAFAPTIGGLGDAVAPLRDDALVAVAIDTPAVGGLTAGSSRLDAGVAGAVVVAAGLRTSPDAGTSVAPSALGRRGAST
jgi:hypothetical protein